ncbi:MAG: hypothetical protein WAO07_03155 [Desulfobacterales bacterium]
MSGPEENKGSLKKKLLQEVKAYWVYVAYLTLVFAAFTQYRRLILADVGIAYTNYWVALIEALILAKVIMIGDALHLGRGLEHKPLIFPTLLKTSIFTLFVGLFILIEHAIKGLIKGKGAVEGVMEFLGKGPYEVLAGGLVIFAAFIPFFALREVGRELGGEVRLLALFFKSRGGQ